MKAEEILMMPKYAGLKNLVLICEAMESFASERTKELEKENERLMRVIMEPPFVKLEKMEAENARLRGLLKESMPYVDLYESKNSIDLSVRIESALSSVEENKQNHGITK